MAGRDPWIFEGPYLSVPEKKYVEITINVSLRDLVELGVIMGRYDVGGNISGILQEALLLYCRALMVADAGFQIRAVDKNGQISPTDSLDTEHLYKIRRAALAASEEKKDQ